MNLDNIDHIQNNLFASSKDFINNNNKVIISLNGLANTISNYTYITEDDPNFPIEKYANEIYNIITYHETIGNNVLIHCDAGVSRTGYYVIYYLIKKNNIKYNEAFNLAKSKRPSILPNEGFELKLRLLELENKILNFNVISNVKFINYKNLVEELNTTFYDNIIGIGKGMNMGNYSFNIENNIDSLLLNIDNIIEKIILLKNPLIYGNDKIIKIIENIYKKNNINICELNNEEDAKIKDYYLGKYKKESNILDITEKEITLMKYSQLVNLLSKLDIYICNDSYEKNKKKLLTNIVLKNINLLNNS
jgi:protein-tyrosine phosphatase